MPNAEDFRKVISEIFEIATKLKLTGVVIKSGNLHRLVGGYPGHNHRMPICCTVMKSMMNNGDEISSQPRSGQGASLEILYRL